MQILISHLAIGVLDSRQPEAHPDVGHGDFQQRGINALQASEKVEDCRDTDPGCDGGVHVNLEHGIIPQSSPKRKQGGEHTRPRRKRPCVGSLNEANMADKVFSPTLRSASGNGCREQGGGNKCCDRDDDEPLPPHNDPASKDQGPIERFTGRTHELTLLTNKHMKTSIGADANTQLPTKDAPLSNLTIYDKGHTEVKTELVSKVSASHTSLGYAADGIDFDLQRREAKNDWELERKMVEIERRERALARKNEAHGRTA